MGQDIKVIAYANKAVLRLQKRFGSLIARGGKNYEEYSTIFKIFS